LMCAIAPRGSLGRPMRPSDMLISDKELVAPHAGQYM
jgi:hypothetical protein